ncbi:MAG: sulfatase [Saprospiraceae bacterium]|nr:sulfatase [Bacteroidia bacterium]NNL92503.1 sulfatase [Saprospiraceae bacterium]
MKRKIQIFVFKCLLLGFLLCACNSHKLESINEDKLIHSPNIIFILTDDQGYGDLSSFGAKDISTPNIDAIGIEGSRYTRFYVPQSQCTPSRAGILTGCYPNRVGVDWVFLPHSKTGLNPDEETIADILKPIGYSTAYFGKWHLGHHHKFLPTNQGFDEYFGIPYSNDMWPLNPRKDYTFPPLPLIHNTTIIDTVDENIQKQMTRLLTEKTIDFIKQNKKNPFFAILSHPMPHVPLYVSDRFKGLSKRGLYGDVMMELDWSVGEIMNTLKELEIDTNTMILFMSDNGPWIAYGNHGGSTGGLKEGKETSFEGGISSPLLIQYPNVIPSGKKIDTAINGIDLLPTIAHLAGAKLPEKKIDGKNILAQLKGEENIMAHDAYYFYMNKNQLEAVMTDRWKLVFPHTFNSLNGKDGGQNGILAQYEKVYTDMKLFDLINDRAETRNVLNNHPDVVNILKAKGDSIRNVLGDKVNNIEGSEVRDLGLLN